MMGSGYHEDDVLNKMRKQTYATPLDLGERLQELVDSGYDARRGVDEHTITREQYNRFHSKAAIRDA